MKLSIYEIEDIDLDSFRTRDTLNSKVWTEDKKLKPEVRTQLLKIADDFFESLEVGDLEIDDIILTGSLSNYNWSKYSDVDLHILVDFNFYLSRQWERELGEFYIDDLFWYKYDNGIYKEVVEDITKLKEKIRKFRKCGLESSGEFSPENLAFKALRRNGYLERLGDLSRDAYDKMMTLKQE